MTPTTTPSPSDPSQPLDYASLPVAPGRTLIDASAGTGKTFAIAGLTLRLVLEGAPLAAPGDESGLPDLRRLLVVTFTNAATEELRTRIRAALRTASRAAQGLTSAADDPLTAPLADLLEAPEALARLRAALARVDEAGIFTIHGFGQRILREAAFESGTPFGLDLVDDDEAVRQRAARDTFARLTHTDAWLAALMLGLQDGKKNALDVLLDHERKIYRHPHTRVEPPQPTLGEALSALHEARAALGDALQQHGDDFEEQLAAIKWKAKALLKGASADDVRARLVACASRLPDALPFAEACSPAAIEEHAYKPKKAEREAREAFFGHPVCLACDGVARAARGVRLAAVPAFAREVRERAAQIRDRRGVQSFDDIIARLHDALHDEATGAALARALRERYAVGLIDEFQDTDPRQYAIFRTAFEGRPLFFIGDPKQAIYGFRGADVRAYLRAAQEADDRKTLGTNFRSNAPLIDAVNALFDRAPRPFLQDGIGFAPAHARGNGDADPRLQGDSRKPFVWWTIENEESDGSKPLGVGKAKDAIFPAIVNEAERLLAGGMTLRVGKGDSATTRRVRAGDLAVLVRTKGEADGVQKLLLERGIPSIVTKAGDIRDSGEMAELECLLLAFSAPEDRGFVRAALATELWGWDANRIAALDESGDSARLLGEVQAAVKRGARTWRKYGALSALTGFIEQEGVIQRLLALPRAERRVTNLRHALDLIHEAETRASRSPDELLHWLRHRSELPLSSQDRAYLRLETDADAVQISTLHNSKGLQYPIVFLPTLWDATWRSRIRQSDAPLVLPDEARGEADPVYFLDDAHPHHAAYRSRYEAEQLAEALRLAYVGLTRAEERCYVAWGPVNQRSPHSPLGYLLHDWKGDAPNLPPDAPAADLAEATARLATKATLACTDALRTWAAGYPDAMTVEPAPSTATPIVRARAPDAAAPSAPARPLRAATRARLADRWRATSFSTWKRDADAFETGEPDADVPVSSSPDAPVMLDSEQAGVCLHAFAPGRAPGNALHTLLEHTDFSAALETSPEPEAAAARAESARATLALHGLLAPRLHGPTPRGEPLDPVATALAITQRAAAAPLLPGGARLEDTSAGARLAEWRFVLPLGRVAPRTLAELFREHATNPLARAYAGHAETLPQAEIDGFLAGSVDLAVLHEERWTIIDWKSNRLGTGAAAYTPDAIERVMLERHYVLQYHLYLVGLHRYLRARLGAAYEYDAHIGGARVVFLRGLPAPGVADARGIFADTPPHALIAALSEALG